MFERITGLFAALLVIGAVAGCKSTNGEKESATAEETSQSASAAGSGTAESAEEGGRATPKEPVAPEVGEGKAVATFAGGCFWCMEKPFEKRKGVVAVVSGFAGGKENDPKYMEVAKGRTGHTETVQIVYKPDQISYEKLLKIYWRQIDPTDSKGQFVDRGSQYRPVIFYHNDRQKRLATKSKQRLAKSGRFDEEIVVPVVPATEFWAAKEYHQNFYETHPDRYQSYRRGSGRDEFIREHWGKEAKVE